MENALLELIKISIKDGSDFDEAIALSVLYGTLASTKRNRIYDGGDVESIFIERFERTFVTIDTNPVNETIHVVSQTYSYGGHTKLMEQLACMEDNKSDVLITQNDRVGYAEGSGLFGEIFNLSKLNNKDKLLEMIKILSRYKRVVLHIFPADFIEAVAARYLKQNSSTQVFFVNHADHVFSFGRTAAHCVLQVSAFGESLTRRYDENILSSFIGIPINSNEEINFNLASQKARTLLTVGSGWKYKPGLGFSLPKLLGKILANDKKVKLMVIGVHPIKDYWWWKIKLLHPKRVSIRRPLSYKEYSEYRLGCSMIIDSYPVTGGTAFPEAILSGKLAFGFSGQMCGYSPADKLRKAPFEEVIRILNNPQRYVEELKCVISELKMVHGIDNVKKRYISSMQGNMQPNPLLDDFTGNVDFFRDYNDTRLLKTLRFVLSLVKIIPFPIALCLGNTLIKRKLLNR